MRNTFLMMEARVCFLFVLIVFVLTLCLETLSDEQQQELVKKLDTVAMDLSDDQTVAEPETEKEPEKELTLNQIIRKTGIPKRKKRCTGRYSGTKGKKKKKSKK